MASSLETETRVGRGLLDTRADRRTASAQGLTWEASPCSSAGQEERQLQMGSSRRTRTGGGDEAAGTALRTAVRDLELDSRVSLENRALTFAASSLYSKLPWRGDRGVGGLCQVRSLQAGEVPHGEVGLTQWPFDPPAGPPPSDSLQCAHPAPPPPALPSGAPGTLSTRDQTHVRSRAVHPPSGGLITSPSSKGA